MAEVWLKLMDALNLANHEHVPELVWFVVVLVVLIPIAYWWERR